MWFYINVLIDMKWYFTVFEYGQRFYADIQSNLHDAVNWALVGMSSVFSANATGVPIKFMGGHQWITSALWYSVFYRRITLLPNCRRPSGWNNTRGRCSRQCHICCASVMDVSHHSHWRICGWQCCQWFLVLLVMLCFLDMPQIWFRVWILQGDNIEKR